VPALKIHSTAPVEPHSAIVQLDAIGAETTVDPWSIREREDSVPLCTPCYRDPSWPEPNAGPAEHHVAASAAAQRPEGLRAPHGESATWRGEPRPGRSGCRLGELVRARCVRSRDVRLNRRDRPGRTRPGTRSGEGGPGPRGPGPERRAAHRDHPAAAGRAHGAETGRPAGRSKKAKKCTKACSSG
jgi:hypothetical protein